MNKECCDHKLKFNAKEDYVFCSECGKRWVVADKCCPSVVIRDVPYQPYATTPTPFTPTFITTY